MYYLLVIIIALLTSSLAFAQGKIGGGGYLGESPYDTVYTEDDSEGSIPAAALKESYLISALAGSERICRPGKLYLQDSGKNFLKIYLALLELQQNFKGSAQYKDIDSFYQCLFTPYVKQTLGEFLEDQEMVGYLTHKYKLPFVRVSLMLVYFQALHKGCYSNACER